MSREGREAGSEQKAGRRRPLAAAVAAEAAAVVEGWRGVAPVERHHYHPAALLCDTKRGAGGSSSACTARSPRRDAQRAHRYGRGPAEGQIVQVHGVFTAADGSADEASLQGRSAITSSYSRVRPDCSAGGDPSYEADAGCCRAAKCPHCDFPGCRKVGSLQPENWAGLALSSLQFWQFTPAPSVAALINPSGAR